MEEKCQKMGENGVKMEENFQNAKYTWQNETKK